MVLVLGTEGDDKQLFGSLDFDSILALGGDDFLRGNAGDDFLNGGPGSDDMAGEADNDMYLVDNSGDIVFEASSNGFDTVDSSVSFSLPNNVEKLNLTGNSNLFGFGNSGNNTIVGNAGNNTLGDSNPNDGADSGDDTIDGEDGTDTIIAAADVNFDLTNTTLIAAGASTTTFKNIESATLFGGAGDNVLDASKFTLGSVSLQGENGNNTLLGGSGNDFLTAGIGDDRFTGGAGNDTIDGGFGVDTIQETGNTFTVSNTSLLGNGIDEFKNVEVVELTGSSDNNLLTAARVNSFRVTFNGGDGSDTLTGGAKSDTLNGGNGDDKLAGGRGNNSLTGGAGVDQFIFNTGTAFTTASVGFASIKDFAHNTDKIVLDKATFTSLQSSVGNVLNSNDFAVVNSGSTAGTAVTGSNARVVFHTPTNSLIYNENGSAVGLGAGGSFAALTGSPALSISDFIVQSSSSNGLTGTPLVQGSNRSDTLIGSNIGGIINGMGSDDKLFSKGGGDIVLGGAGSDVLNGGAGDDLLRGGKGPDTLVGGQGADTFVFEKGTGVDVIKDFQVGVDRLGFMGDVASADISFVAHRGGTSVLVGGQASAWMRTRPEQLSLTDVVQVGMTQLSGMNVPTVLG
ncbi:MAG TPA: calcium-binding protein [Trichocoleus sp.]|jgi:Ca2+-binding RTX toxin-like protein